METDTWKIENNICRCCHAEGYFFNLGEPRPFCGETEVYADMIRDIFDIDMQPVPGPVCDLTYTICMSCIFKLREAVQFKKQVQRCEDKFLDYYYTNKLEVSKKKEVQSKAVIKLEPVVEFKEEYLNEDELDSNDDTNPEFEMDDDDDESKSDDDLASLSKKGKGKGKGKSESVLPKTEGAAVKAEQGSAKKKLVKVERIKVPVKKRGIKKIELQETKPVIDQDLGDTNAKKKRKIGNKVLVTIEEKEDGKDGIVVKKSGRVKSVKKLHKQYHNIEQILTCTNATPIRRHDDLGYYCCYCEDQYQEAADLKQHTIERHRGIENASFNNKKGLHGLLLKLDITELCCLICGSSIENLDDIFTHLTEVHGRMFYTDVKHQIVPFKFVTDVLQCHICFSVLSTFKLLVSHMMSHCRNFVCDICDTGYVSRKHYNLHVRNLHTGTYKCDACDLDFDTYHKKQAHIRYYHSQRSSLYKCGFCNETFTNYRQKLAHCKDAHGIYNEIKCNACDKTFWNQQSLRVHRQRDHLLERRAKCNLCEKSFYSSTSLKNHMIKHGGERNYQCDICLKSYARKSTIRQHMRIHNDDRRHKCQYCGQAFVQKCSWRGHMRSRHGEIV